jgi:hypothetical protein
VDQVNPPLLDRLVSTAAPMTPLVSVSASEEIIHTW